MKARKKQHNQENFPVVSILLAKKYHEIVMDYYRFARYSDDVADNPKLSENEKLSQLDEIENIFLGKSYKGKKLAFAVKLKETFIKENLSASLATDLLVAFRQDAKGLEYQTWGQLVNYCNYSAAPVGRFMLAIHDENPSTYLPGNALCVALQIVNHLQDLKYDAKLLKRVYIPTDLQQKYNVKAADFLKNQSSAEVKALVKDMVSKVKGLLKDAEILPQIVNSYRLRSELYVILSLTNIMIKSIEDGDVLAQDIKLSKSAWFMATLSGLIKGLFTKKKSLTIKGL